MDQDYTMSGDDLDFTDIALLDCPDESDIMDCQDGLGPSDVAISSVSRRPHSPIEFLRELGKSPENIHP